MIRKLPRSSPTPGTRPVRKLVGTAFLLGLIATHLAGDVTNRLPSAAAQSPAATAAVEATRQTFCPRNADHIPLVENKSIHLQDGTTVDLNGDGCIDVRISTEERLVRLDSGEAIFRVAPEARRPFIVETGQISIRVLGTTFDVYRKQASTRVSVNEGAVQIFSADAASRPNIKPLTVLQQIDVPDALTEPRVRRSITPGDFKRITAWVHGEIELNAQTLQEVLEEFDRYQSHHATIIFSDPKIAQMRFSGLFHTTNLNDFLQLLPLKCIHSEYNEEQQQITLTFVPGNHAAGCPKL